MTTAELAQELGRLLDLNHPAVAVTFHEQGPPEGSRIRPTPEPAGCCFWIQAEHRRLDTTSADHANCSVGSYVHGLISLDDAAAAEDTAALLGSGWVTEGELVGTPSVAMTPGVITYDRLEEVELPDIVLVRLTVGSLMTLQGACPELTLVTKPQCQIVPLALAGEIAVSPGCAVSRVRTGLPADELTCAFPANQLADIVTRLNRSVAADTAVSAYADADLERNFSSPS